MSQIPKQWWLTMIMHHYTEVECVRRNQYELQIFPIYGRERIYYGEIMIYVKGRRDVRFSKGWRYEPIMINALSTFSPSPPRTLVCDQRWSSSVFFWIRLLSIPPPHRSLQHFHRHTVTSFCTYSSSLSFLFFFLSDTVPSSSLLCCPSVVVSSMWFVYVETILQMMDSNDPEL